MIEAGVPNYEMIGWNTGAGRKEWTRRGTARLGQPLQVDLELTSDIAVAVRPIS